MAFSNVENGMDRNQKAEVVSALNAHLADVGVVVVTRNLGMTVAQSTVLRQKMREAGGTYKVTKNRLARIALDGTAYTALSDMLTGPVGLATSVYPAIWAFWGIARFGWSEAMIGMTLAVFGLITAVVQGGLTGPVVKWLGERNTTILGLATAVIAAAGYGLAPDLVTVLILFLVHAPEGFVQPALTALMTKEAPEDAQGELQGGIASLQNIGMIAGTLLFAMTFGWFMKPNPIIVSADVGYFLSAAILAATLAYFLARGPGPAATRR